MREERCAVREETVKGGEQTDDSLLAMSAAECEAVIDMGDGRREVR